MAIVAGDILRKLSIKTGSAGNSAAQGDVNASLGKYISTTQITDNTLHNLFDVITGPENAASTVDYRCVFVHNAHATLTAYDVRIFISAEVSGGAAAAIGVDTTAASAIGSASAQAVDIANETTAPSGISFSSPTTYSGGVQMGDIPAGQCRAYWVRRTAANTAAVDADGVTIRVQCDSPA
jgi:hypothetical protein